MTANEYVTAAFAAALAVAHYGYADNVEEMTPQEKSAREFAESLKDRSANTEIGYASIFWQPQPLACGGTLSYKTIRNDWAAHPSLPCWTRVTVTSQDTCCGNKSVDVYIVDRGPYVEERIIDLMPQAAAKIGLTKRRGVMPVFIEWNPLERQYPERSGVVRKRKNGR